MEKYLLSRLKINAEIDEFCYVGPTNGFAQVALALACEKLKKKVCLIK